jgi:hypothetical protein
VARAAAASTAYFRITTGNTSDAARCIADACGSAATSAINRSRCAPRSTGRYLRLTKVDCRLLLADAGQASSIRSGGAGQVGVVVGVEDAAAEALERCVFPVAVD